MIGSLTIGIPGFFLALAPAHDPVREGLVKRVALRSLPGGLIAAFATLAAYVSTGWLNDSLSAQRTVAVVTLFAASFTVLTMVAHPLTAWRIGLLAAVLASFVALVAFPAGRRFLDLSLPSVGGYVAAALASTLAAIGIVLFDRRNDDAIVQNVS